MLDKSINKKQTKIINKNGFGEQSIHSLSEDYPTSYLITPKGKLSLQGREVDVFHLNSVIKHGVTSSQDTLTLWGLLMQYDSKYLCCILARKVYSGFILRGILRHYLRRSKFEAFCEIPGLDS